MIRILQVVMVMNVGGIEVLLMNLYRNIDRSRVQFDFLLHRDYETYFEKEISKLGGRIYRVPPVNPLHHRAYIKALKSFFKEHTEFKIVHAHNNALSMYVLRAAKKAGVPVRIAHSHTADVAFDIKRTVFYNYCRSKINKYSNYSFACSINAGKWLFGKSIIDSEHFHVLRNGIDFSKFSYTDTARQEMRRGLGIGDQLLIGHIGNFIHYKNHKYLLEIFSEIIKPHQNSLLVLIGDGELRKVIEKQAKDMKLADRILFLGVRSDVAQCIQAIDLLILPSLFEGFGIVLVEAQASGLPCLASDTVPKEAKVTNLLEFMSLEDSPKQWAEKALQMIKDTPRRNHTEEVKAAGYDISETARWLQDFYLARYEEAMANHT